MNPQARQQPHEQCTSISASKCKYCKIIQDFTLEHKDELRLLGAKTKFDLHLLW